MFEEKMQQVLENQMRNSRNAKNLKVLVESYRHFMEIGLIKAPEYILPQKDTIGFAQKDLNLK